MHRSKAAMFHVMLLLGAISGCTNCSNDHEYMVHRNSFHHPLRQALLSIKSQKCDAVVIRTTTTRIPFGIVMPRTFTPNGWCGCDYCGHIENSGQFSPVETHIFDRVLSYQCRSGQGTVIDVGGNIGYFAALAASYGCRVVSFEPNEEPRNFMLATVAYNGFTDRVRVVAAAAGGQRTTAAMSATTGWGYGKPVDSPAQPDGTLLEISMVPLEAVVRGDVLLMKVDTEGFEINVFSGAWDFLRNNDVKNVVVEVKDFNSAAKKALMRNITEIGRFTHVYNYKEHYTWYYEGVINVTKLIWTPAFAESMVDVTAAITKPDSNVMFQFEDFWFTKEQVV